MKTATAKAKVEKVTAKTQTKVSAKENTKLTRAQKIMIDDGLPKEVIIDKTTRDEAWAKNPPKKGYSPPPLDKNFPLKPSEITMLFSLLDSKARGAASLGCDSHIAEIAVLERLGYARQTGFGPTSFVITEAGVKKSETLKRPEPPKVIEPTPQKPTKPYSAPTKSGKREPKDQDAKAAKPPKAKVIKPDLNLSPICTECGVTSKNRSAALDMLAAKIGKMNSIEAVIKAVYNGDGSEGAADTVIRGLQRDMENGKAKETYEVKRIKDAKGVYTYGLFKK